MTDKQLIQALRKVHDAHFTPGVHSHSIYGVAAIRLEALLAENERLKAGKDKNVPTKWVSVAERLPDKSWNYLAVACDEGAPADERIWGCRVVVVADYSRLHNTWTWDENGTEYDLTGLVTHWMPIPEPPSTEGVE